MPKSSTVTLLGDICHDIDLPNIVGKVPRILPAGKTNREYNEIFDTYDIPPFFNLYWVSETQLELILSDEEDKQVSLFLYFNPINGGKDLKFVGASYNVECFLSEE